MRLKTQQSGFTVIELLVVIVIVGVIGSILAVIMINVMRGTKKAETISLVRQNGTYALEQMVRKIRYAQTLEGIGQTSPSSTTCVAPVTNAHYLQISDFNDDKTTYICPNQVTPSIATIASQSAETGVSVDLTDPETVYVTSCSFTCSQKDFFSPPTITIDFTLKHNGSTGIIESDVQIPFSSAVTMRNYGNY